MNQEDIPYFLKPSVAPVPMDGTFDLFNYDTLQGTAYDGSVRSVWDELSAIPQKAGGFVYDSATGIWSGVTSFGSDVIEGIESRVDSVISGTMKWILIGGAFILVFIWVLGKSGTAGALASGAGAFFGARG